MYKTRKGPKKGASVSEKTYIAMKEAFDRGLTGVQVAKLFNYSHSVASRANCSDTYEEFKEMGKNKFRRKNYEAEQVTIDIEKDQNAKLNDTEPSIRELIDTQKAILLALQNLTYTIYSVGEKINEAWK